ncbi:hypothetical protein Rumeso_04132 [Rubellimicrobium mesophilum DSM 19309]|uniref:DUF4386 family protein n=1 Tax=Rubellimicrobium mesophilum DSM 19309 TaxID=442562 RepID=A0A017HJC8_9RHOB|nr:DUF4386 family protein [Rubellimicrobium mesophilum]EYD74268.1 hypothetical protein Rumeso_04132 [Rubellimicrobium mesophilum DSM 19309]
MTTGTLAPCASLRGPARLLLGGQLLHVAVTQFHAGGDANDHHAIFEAYARDRIWAAVHLGQFAATAILLAGLMSLSLALDDRDATKGRVGRLGAASAVAALALYGVLQAVDGVALKQAVSAWASAPEAEKAARFAVAESVRWLEWGLRSYQDVAMGLSLLLLSLAALRAGRLPQPVAGLMGLSGASYLAQGWVAGTEGFSPAQSVAIVLGWVLSLSWMIWLVAATWRLPASGALGATQVDPVKGGRSEGGFAEAG